MAVTVGYQGIPGSFSEQALRQYFDGSVSTKDVKYFEDVFVSLHQGAVDYGVLPIENSNTGMIFEVYDCLQQYNLYIVGETYVKVAHQLLGIPGARLSDINEVFSHPQGFQQSRRFLQQYGDAWRLTPYYNTAISARFTAETGDRTKAAIASARCAEIYNLDILRTDIHDEDHNYTRFIIISRDAAYSSDADKLSVVYSLPHSVGSLYKSLGVFADHGINLLNLQSRPIRGRPWEWYFYLDLQGSLNEGNMQAALEKVRQLTHYLQILGCYGAKPNRLPLERS